MKNVNELSEMTQNINSRDRSTWITLYYSIQDDAVYSSPKKGAFKVTELINPNTEKEIVGTVKWWMSL